jgi:transposase-like protein
MGKNKRRNFSSDFKAKVAIEAIKEKQTLSELATKYELHPTQISDWKKAFLVGANMVFEQDSESKKEKVEDTSALYEQIGRLQMDIAFLKKKL